MKYIREVWELFSVKPYKSRNKNTDQYKSYWWISNHGRVKITFNYKDDVKWPLLAPTGGHIAKRYLALSVNDAPEKYVHRLVAKYFVDNPDPEKNTVVHHKDHNKHNNHWSNLEWTTHKENRRAYVKYKAKKKDA